MKMLGSKRREIRDALISAYLSKADLAMFLDDVDLAENLDAIAGGDNYTVVVYNLIKKVEANGSLEQLIKLACEHNPGNKNLKDIYNQLFSNFSSCVGIESDTCPISNEQWDKLCSILYEINLPLLGRVCRITLENLTRIQDVSGNYPELLELKKFGILKTILLNKLPRNDKGIPSIVEFAERLSKEKEVGESEIKDLNMWLVNIAKELNITLPTYSEAKSFTILQSYLMITVEPNRKSSQKFDIEAQLIPDYRANDAKNSLIRLELNQESTKVECSFQDIADKIYQYIGIAQSQHFKQDNYDLTIEIFLPLQLLGTSIDLEEIPIGFNGRRPIGNEYKFLVRSYERFTEEQGRYRNSLSIRWNQLTQWIQKRPSQTDFQKKIHHILKREDCNWKQIENKLNNEQKLGVKMTCCLPQADVYHTLFQTVFRGGVPIALWIRSNTIPNIEQEIEQEFDTLLNLECFQQDFSNFIEFVWKLRQKAHEKTDKENYLGYYLGFLYDNPNRVPFHLMPENKWFIETGM